MTRLYSGAPFWRGRDAWAANRAVDRSVRARSNGVGAGAAYRARCAHHARTMLEAMTLRIGDIVLDCQDPRLAAEFWCAALGYRVTDTDDTGVAVAGDSSAPTLLFLASTDHKVHKNRVHFDVCPVEGTTRDDEVARLESLGATRIDVGQTSASWVVMADPDGNEFCVMNTVLPAEPAPFHHL